MGEKKPCPTCRGEGVMVRYVGPFRETKVCPECGGKRRV